MKHVALMAVFLLVLTGCASPPTAVQDDPDGRMALLDTVWQTIAERHVDPPPPGWEAARERHRAAVLAAPPLAQDPEALWAALDGVAAEWRDAHTRVEGPRDIARQLRHEFVTLGFSLIDVEGQWVAQRVDPQSAAYLEGLRNGMRLLSWNGEPPDAVWARLQANPRPSSTPQATATRALRRWLDGAPGTVVQSRWLNQDGSELALVSERRTQQRPPTWKLEERQTGVAVLRWNQFDTRLEAPLTEALAQLPSTVRGLILDLRGNGGGSFAMTQRLAASFLPEPQPGAIVGRKGDPGRPQVLGGKPLYTGPLVVLLDRVSASGSELLARTLQMLGRAKVVGELSCGCLLSVSRYLPLAPSARLAVSDGHIRWDNGRVEGLGVMPDVPVTRTLAALREGRDEVLARAEGLLLREASAP